MMCVVDQYWSGQDLKFVVDRGNPYSYMGKGKYWKSNRGKEMSRDQQNILE